MTLPDVFKLKYDGTWLDLTITLASLATDANLLAGRESTAVSNTTNLYTDVRLTGKIATGTSPTASKTIEGWAYGEWNDASTYPDVLDGTDSDETITSADIKNAMMALAFVINTDGTSDQAYPFDVGSLASLFGGVIPPQWGVFIVHDTGVNLNATGGNHQVSYQGVHEQVTDT